MFVITVKSPNKVAENWLPISHLCRERAFIEGGSIFHKCIAKQTIILKRQGNKLSFVFLLLSFGTFVNIGVRLKGNLGKKNS